jgi:hypothetical protein
VEFMAIGGETPGRAALLAGAKKRRQFPLYKRNDAHNSGGAAVPSQHVA